MSTTIIPSMDLEMATTSAEIAFGAPLRKTTRTAIFLSPLFWTAHQLRLLRVLLIHLNQPNPQSFENQVQQLAAARMDFSSVENQIDSLSTYWRWCNYSAGPMSNYWLSEAIMMVMDYLQRDMGFRFFVKQVVEE